MAISKIRRLHPLMFAAVLASITTAAVASPRYLAGQTGTFGLPMTDSWNYNSVGQTLNSLDDAYSVSFTATSNFTIDRAMQRYVGVDAGTTLRIGIQADNGSGAPDGTFISSTVFDPIDGSPVSMIAFTPVNLTSGNVYHLVTQPETLGVGESMFIYTSSSSNAYRPYDRALDPAQHRNVKTNGGAWISVSSDPYVIFANGSDTNVIPEISQPYGTMGSTSILTQGGGGSRIGTEFSITDGEVPVGATVRISDVTLRLAKGGALNPSQVFTLALRELDGTLLGKVDVPVNTIPSGTNTLTWNFDSPIDLTQGQSYLFTTSFAAGSTSSDIISLYIAYAPYPAGVGGDSGWLGRIASRASSDDWTTHTTSASIGDLPVSFTGVVFVPEPASLVLMTLAGVALVGRRNRMV